MKSEMSALTKPSDTPHLFTADSSAAHASGEEAATDAAPDAAPRGEDGVAAAEEEEEESDDDDEVEADDGDDDDEAAPSPGMAGRRGPVYSGPTAREEGASVALRSFAPSSVAMASRKAFCFTCFSHSPSFARASLSSGRAAHTYAKSLRASLKRERARRADPRLYQALR